MVCRDASVAQSIQARGVGQIGTVTRAVTPTYVNVRSLHIGVGACCNAVECGAECCRGETRPANGLGLVGSRTKVAYLRILGFGKHS